MTENNLKSHNEQSITSPVKELKGIGGWLLLFIIGTFISAVSNLVFAFGSGESGISLQGMVLVTNPGLSLLIGLIALAAGIMLLKVKNRSAVTMTRIYMISYLAANILIAIIGFKAPAGYYIINEEAMIVRGIFSAIVMNLIWQSYFSKSKRVQNTYQIIERSTLENRGAFNSVSSIFDKKKYGVNYYFGLAFFLISLISSFIYSLVYSIIYSDHFSLPPFSYYLTYLIPAYAIDAVLLLLVLYFIPNDWFKAVSFGLCGLIRFMSWRFIIGNYSFGSIARMESVPSIITAQDAINLFTWFSLLVLAIILALRTGGLKLNFFILYMIGGFLIHGLISQFLYKSVNEIYFDFNYYFIIQAAADGAATAVVLYYSIYYFLKKKGVLIFSSGSAPDLNISADNAS